MRVPLPSQTLGAADPPDPPAPPVPLPAPPVPMVVPSVVVPEAPVVLALLPVPPDPVVPLAPEVGVSEPEEHVAPCATAATSNEISAPFCKFEYRILRSVVRAPWPKRHAPRWQRRETMICENIESKQIVVNYRCLPENQSLCASISNW